MGSSTSVTKASFYLGISAKPTTFCVPDAHQHKRPRSQLCLLHLHWLQLVDDSTPWPRSYFSFGVSIFLWTSHINPFLPRHHLEPHLSSHQYAYLCHVITRRLFRQKYQDCHYLRVDMSRMRTRWHGGRHTAKMRKLHSLPVSGLHYRKDTDTSVALLAYSVI